MQALVQAGVLSDAVVREGQGALIGNLKKLKMPRRKWSSDRQKVSLKFPHLIFQVDRGPPVVVAAPLRDVGQDNRNTLVRHLKEDKRNVSFRRLKGEVGVGK